jgi:hypothetical protein
MFFPRNLSSRAVRRSSSGGTGPTPIKESPMKFVMLICGSEDEWTDLAPTDEQDVMKQIFKWYEKWQPTGKIVDGGAELQNSRTAKTVRSGPGGEPVVTDGPYLELKEVIGGFVVLECDTIDDAVAVAAEWPRSAGMDAIEVRPVMERG